MHNQIREMLAEKGTAHTEQYITDVFFADTEKRDELLKLIK